MLSVPVFLEYQDGRKEQGYISYAISQKGILFHRCYAKAVCFDDETKDLLDNKLQESFNTTIMEQSYNKSMGQALFFRDSSEWRDEGTLSVQDRSIIIGDDRHKLTIIVPRIFTEDEVHATEFYKKYYNRCQRIENKKQGKKIRKRVRNEKKTQN